MAPAASIETSDEGHKLRSVESLACANSEFVNVNSKDAAALEQSTCCENRDGCREAGTPGDVPYVDCCSTPFNFWIHSGLLAALAPVGFIAWISGLRRHRRLGILVLGLGSAALLATALLITSPLAERHAAVGWIEQILTVMGSIGLMTAHLWNRRQCSCCKSLQIGAAIDLSSSEGVYHHAACATPGVMP